jgi:hypothetical protein
MKEDYYLNKLADQLFIDERKFKDYLLNPNHPDGKNKAEVFKLILGFDQENYHELIKIIEEKGLSLEATYHSTNEYGKCYSTIIEITGVTGKTANVLIGWIIEFNNRIAKLTTARILKKSK